MKHHLRKRRTREHIIADLGVNHVERHALLCGYAVERMLHDYGIDVVLFTFNENGENEEGKILMQVKASDKLRIDSRRATFAFRIERSHLLSWLMQPMPMILVVYNAQSEKAYWIYIQKSFGKATGFNLFAAGKTVTARIPTVNLLDPSAVRRFARFRDRILKQLGELIHDED